MASTTPGSSGGSSSGPPGQNLHLFDRSDEIQFAWDTVDSWVRLNRNNPIILNHLRSLTPLLARYLVLAGGRFNFLDFVCLSPFPGSAQLRINPDWAEFPNNSQYHWAGNDAYSLITFEVNGSWTLDADGTYGTWNQDRLAALFSHCSRGAQGFQTYINVPRTSQNSACQACLQSMGPFRTCRQVVLGFANHRNVLLFSGQCTNCVFKGHDCSFAASHGTQPLSVPT
ncbi:hypothetical protein K469DRAFT_688771 [Zopfia rhizophila CBS 207.26]|uniref:Uncharacterized protein n=1 Tax=Zopfia rhizophila CBS 207.26 TaxID=1314779 RepID=A0A6A6E305_9PEZI|nr:hypothetical protein K469DRAFT_688771 [Zopfia rhizophila CBS 207.26]